LIRNSNWFHCAICWCWWLSCADLTDGHLSKSHWQHQLVVIYYTPWHRRGQILPFLLHK
jgi:hypothetical protein